MAENRKHKGGRPSKPLSEKRRYTLRFRVNTAEYIAVKEKARSSNLTVSEYARCMVLKGQVVVPIRPEELRLIAELTREKNNLNQIAKAQNAAGATAMAATLQKIILFYIDVITKIKRHDRENSNG